MQIRLQDGRCLSYAEYGSPSGRPVLYFHGLPGSRLQRPPEISPALRRKVRLITIDRPGMGHSTFLPGRRFLDWPNDVQELANALGIDRFAVIGVSGGGPYAAACAYGIPNRLSAVALVSSLSPFTRPGIARGAIVPVRVIFSIARRCPKLLLPLYGLLLPMVRRGRSSRPRVAAFMPKPDRDVLVRPQIKAMLAEDLAEATRQGVRGAAHETALIAKPWGFKLSDIRTPVHLWHGTADTMVPVAMGQLLASAIPDCRPTWLSGEGHFLVFDRLPEILDAAMRAK